MLKVILEVFRLRNVWFHQAGRTDVIKPFCELSGIYTVVAHRLDLLQIGLDDRDVV